MKNRNKSLNNLLKHIAAVITRIIDFFYPPFRPLFSPQLFRYAACGGGNMVLDWLLYFLFYNFVVGHENVDLGIVTLTPHIATLCIVFPITLLTGFYLNKFVTFTESSVRTRKQLLRYVSVVILNLAINYFGLKLFVEVCGIWPTISKVMVTLITVLVSYFSSKYYSFRK